MGLSRAAAASDLARAVIAKRGDVGFELSIRPLLSAIWTVLA